MKMCGIRIINRLRRTVRKTSATQRRKHPPNSFIIIAAHSDFPEVDAIYYSCLTSAQIPSYIMHSETGGCNRLEWLFANSAKQRSSRTFRCRSNERFLRPHSSGRSGLTFRSLQHCIRDVSKPPIHTYTSSMQIQLCKARRCRSRETMCNNKWKFSSKTNAYCREYAESLQTPNFQPHTNVFCSNH